MKHRTIRIAIIITSLALLGVIATQLYWVNDAVKLKNEQFNQKVNLSLNKFINQLLTRQNDSVLLERFKMDKGDNFPITLNLFTLFNLS